MTTAVLPNTATEPSLSPPTHLRICFDLPGSLTHIVHLRKTSRCYVECLGLCREDVDDLEMLLGELSTNVVRHAKAGTYHVSIEVLEDRYIVHVIDKGIGFAPDTAAAPYTHRPDTLSEGGEERIGGMGLIMIRAIADQVEIVPTDPQGTTIRATKLMTTPAKR